MRTAHFALLTLIAAPAFAQTVGVYESPRGISVSGEAAIMVVPDQAIVMIGVETFDAKLDVAAATNERTAKGLIAEWKKLGIADSNIKTSGVSVSIAYDDQHRTPSRTIVGYVVRRSYDITAGSAALAEQVINRGLANGANQISEIDFRSTEMRKYRDQARIQATRAAREKAELIATQLGATVGPPRNITETTSYYSGRYQQNSMSQNVTSYPPDGGESDSAGAVAPGQIAVRASVSVTFDLVTKKGE
jgi:uncharacterized protein YggE